MAIQPAATTRSCTLHPALSTVQVFEDNAVTRFGNQLRSSVIQHRVLDRFVGKGPDTERWRSGERRPGSP